VALNATLLETQAAMASSSAKKKITKIRRKATAY
jgi:hypothetical protein